MADRERQPVGIRRDRERQLLEMRRARMITAGRALRLSYTRWAYTFPDMQRDNASVTVEAATLGQFDTIIDARTPLEYAEDHIPGAVSAPVLDDAQRAEIGTMYKQVSAFEEKKIGA